MTHNIWVTQREVVKGLHNRKWGYCKSVEHIYLGQTVSTKEDLKKKLEARRNEA